MNCNNPDHPDFPIWDRATRSTTVQIVEWIAELRREIARLNELRRWRSMATETPAPDPSVGRRSVLARGPGRPIDIEFHHDEEPGWHQFDRGQIARYLWAYIPGYEPTAETPGAEQSSNEGVSPAAGDQVVIFGAVLNDAEISALHSAVVNARAEFGGFPGGERFSAILEMLARHARPSTDQGQVNAMPRLGDSDATS